MIAALRRFVRRAVNTLRPYAREADLERELLAHVALVEDEQRLRGFPPDEARLAAKRTVGSIAYAKDLHRDARSFTWIDDVRRDFQYAARILLRTPAFSAVAVLTLALGIGANTAIFSLVDSLLLRSLPVKQPDQLVDIVAPTPQGVRKYWTYPFWEQIRDRPNLFARALAWSHNPVNLAPQGEMQMVDAVLVSGGFFDVLGIHAILGRLLTPADDKAGGGADGPVAVISYSFWQSRFNGSADVIGRTLTLNGVPFTIVGVMPEGFFGPSVGAYYSLAAPLGTQPLLSSANNLNNPIAVWLAIMARLKPGQTAAAASAALQEAQPAVRQATLPTRSPPQALADYLKDPLVAQSAPAGVDSPMRVQYRTPLLVILAVVGLVLVIACVNLTNLLLARAEARRPELGLRLALGASRARLVRQLLVETLILSFAGAALGLAFAVWASRLILTQLVFQGSGIFLDLSLDRTVLGFTAAISILVALLFGTMPAIRATGLHPSHVLAEPWRITGGQVRRRRFQILVALQVALSLVLVIGAGLFVRSFVALAHLDAGFDEHAVLVVTVSAGGRGGLSTILREQVLDAIRSAPGVHSAAWSLRAPLEHSQSRFLIENPPGLALPEGERFANANAISPGWLATTGIQFVSGRDFDAHDTAGAPAVAIVNEAFAKRFFPSAAAVGRTISELWGLGKQPPSIVIGVVRDAAFASLRDRDQPTIYRPLGQVLRGPASPVGTLCIRTTQGSAPAVIRDVAGAVSTSAPDLQFTFHTMDDLAGESLATERVLAMLSGFFGTLALLLAAIGLYGIVSYTVNRQRTEIGIRMALGAQPGRIVGMVLRRIGVILVIGLALGGVLSVWVAQFVKAMLYGLQPHDPVTIIGAIVVLAAVGLLASWLPARRAALIDPTEALREQ